MTETKDIPPIERPNGKLYRPRKIVAFMVGEEDEGVLVLGTHDRQRAQPLADQMAGHVAGHGFVAAEWVTGWYRDGFECGERRWVSDEVHGRPGVYFREIVETVPAGLAGTP
jgi:hypothetical protein